MTQITIYCSEKLDLRIDQILHKNGIEEFFTITGMSVTRLKDRESLGKDQAWSGNAFIVYPNGHQVDGLLADLKSYADECGDQPCMHIVMTPVERIC